MTTELACTLRTQTAQFLASPDQRIVKKAADALQDLSHALICISHAHALLCRETGKQRPSEMLGVCAAALRKAGLPDAADDINRVTA